MSGNFVRVECQGLSENNKFNHYLDNKTGLLYLIDDEGNISDVFIGRNGYGEGYSSVFDFICCEPSKILDSLKTEIGKEIKLDDDRILFFTHEADVKTKFYDRVTCEVAPLIEIVKVEDKNVIRRKCDGKVLFEDGGRYEEFKRVFAGLGEIRVGENLLIGAGVLIGDMEIPSEIDGVEVKSLSWTVDSYVFSPFSKMMLRLPSSIKEINFGENRDCEYRGPMKIMVQDGKQVKLVRDALRGRNTSSKNRSVEIYLKDKLEGTVELQERDQSQIDVRRRKKARFDRFVEFVEGAKDFFKIFFIGLFAPIWVPIWLIYKAVEYVVVAIKNRIRRNETVEQQKENSVEQKAENVANQDKDEKNNQLTTEVSNNPNVPTTSENDEQKIPPQANLDGALEENENSLSEGSL